MNDIQVTREQSVSYGAQGKVVSSDETYIKIAVSFTQLLQTFKGARLSAFLCLALNEAEISFGRSIGLSIYDIAEQSGYDERTVLRSVQYFIKYNFADRISAPGTNGETLYRVSGYAWFGNPRSTPPASNRRCDKMSYPVENVIAGMTKSPRRRSVHTESKSVKSTSCTEGVVEKILRAANLHIESLDVSSMDEERAQAIADYIADNPEKKRAPAGYAYACLKNNPAWSPPQRMEQSRLFAEPTHADFSDAQWARLLPLTRRGIIARERGCDLAEVGEDEL